MNIKSIWNRIMVDIPEEDAEEFENHCFYQNINRLLMAGVIALVLESLLSVVTVYMVAMGKAPQSQLRYIVLYMIMIITGASLIYMNKKYRNGSIVPTKYGIYYVPIMAFISILWSAVVSIMDLSGEYGQPTVYISLVFLSMVFLVMKPKHAFLILMSVLIFFSATYVNLLKDETDFFGNIINVSFNSLLAWVVSRSIYISSYQNFKANEMVRKQNEQLIQLNMELTVLSSTDPLTKLYNRRAFTALLKHDWQLAQREGICMTIALMDIDKFKDYNDYYGHQAGDECLVAVADSIKGCLKREGDIVTRYGGEEFIVCFAGNNSENSARIFEEIRRSVEQQRIPHEGIEKSSVVTISIGFYCAVPDKECSYEKFIKNADKALYESKEKGRNQVTEFFKP